MKYDSSLTVYDIILKRNRWSLLFWVDMYSLHNILSSFSRLTNVSSGKKYKNQVDFIEWNHMPQALNLYFSSDKQIWHITEICIFCGFL